MSWFYAKGKEQVGPVDDTQLEALVLAGTIGPDTLVWREGMSAWQPYATAVRILTPAPAGSAVCLECGKVFPQGDMIRHGQAWVCAGCKPIFLQKLSEGVAVGVDSSMRYAGFWIRFCAKFVDGLILAAVCFIPMMVVMAMIGGFANQGDKPSAMATVVPILFQLGYYVVFAAYSIFFVGKYGATPGKMACKLKVVDASGASIGYGRATGRFFAEILSGLICYIGYLMVIFDPEKRALHDRICNTRVIQK